MIKKIIKNLKLSLIACSENSFQPRFLEANFLFRLVLIFLILKIVILPFYLSFPKTMFFAQIVSSDILQLLNQQRQYQGLNGLNRNPKLEKAALLKAQDMINKDYFGHQSPDGISGWYWIKTVNYDYSVAGENLAIGFMDSDEVYQAWNESKLHRENLLSPYFEDVGIAVLSGDFQGQETTVIVQLFAKPKIVLTRSIAEIEENEIPFPEKVESQKELEENSEEAVSEESPEEAIVQEEVAPSFIKAADNESESTNLSEQKSSFKSGIWHFLTQQYDDLLKTIVWFIAFVILIILISNLIVVIAFALPKEQKITVARTIIPASLTAIIVLSVLGFLDKSLILQIIPHHLQI